MTDYAAIKAQLDRPELRGLSDAEVVAFLAAEQIEVDRPASGAALRNVLLRTRSLGRIVLRSRQVVAVDDETAHLVAAAINVVSALDPVATLPADDDDLWAALTDDLEVLRQAGDVAKNYADALIAERKRSVTRAEAIGFPALRVGDVATARATFGLEGARK